MAKGNTYNCGLDVKKPEAYASYEAAFAKMNEGLSKSTLNIIKNGRDL